MTREAVMRRLVCVRRFGMGWGEAGTITLGTFHLLVEIDNEAHKQETEPPKSARRTNGVTRTPIT